jgi:hypothetical protein
MPTPNAEVDYVSEDGHVIETVAFYDPGIDENSWYAKEQKARRVWRGKHLAYGCGRPLPAAPDQR